MLNLDRHLHLIIKLFLIPCPFGLIILLPTSLLPTLYVSAQSNQSQTSSYETSSPFTADLGRVVPVNRLSEILPTDWRSQQLNRIDQRTTCLGREYRHDRAITRAEFAVGLKECFDKLNINNLTPEEFDFMARMEREFAEELADLEQRLNNLEVRTEKLAAQQFSTTTILTGEVLFQLGDSFSSDDNSSLFTGYRSRLNFDTSFYGEDRLRVRLDARNTGELEEVEDTAMVRLGVDGESEDELGAEISYDFAIGEHIEGVVGVSSVGADDVAEVLNPLSSSGQGAVSRFARRNPATLRGAGGTGAGIQYELNDSLQVSLGYFVDGDDAADDSAGLFGGSYSGVAQLLAEPVDDLEVALTYTRNYYREDEARLMGATGSENANEPFEEDPTSSNNFGLQANWELSDRLELGGWFGYTVANSEIDDESATILNTALTLSLPDLGKEGSEAGIIIGIPPIVTQHDDSAIEDERTSLHLETFYRYAINDNIQITPGVFWITQPDHSDRDFIVVGTIRTRFRF